MEGKATQKSLSFHPPPSTFHLVNQWQSNINRFIAGLRQLKSENQITEENILKLLKPAVISSEARPVGRPATMGASAVYSAAAPRTELRADLLPHLKIPRAEARRPDGEEPPEWAKWKKEVEIHRKGLTDDDLDVRWQSTATLTLFFGKVSEGFMDAERDWIKGVVGILKDRLAMDVSEDVRRKSAYALTRFFEKVSEGFMDAERDWIKGVVGILKDHLAGDDSENIRWHSAYALTLFFGKVSEGFMDAERDWIKGVVGILKDRLAMDDNPGVRRRSAKTLAVLSHRFPELFFKVEYFRLILNLWNTDDPNVSPEAIIEVIQQFVPEDIPQDEREMSSTGAMPKDPTFQSLAQGVVKALKDEPLEVAQKSKDGQETPVTLTRKEIARYLGTHAANDKGYDEFELDLAGTWNQYVAVKERAGDSNDILQGAEQYFWTMLAARIRGTSATSPKPLRAETRRSGIREGNLAGSFKRGQALFELFDVVFGGDRWKDFSDKRHFNFQVINLAFNPFHAATNLSQVLLHPGQAFSEKTKLAVQILEKHPRFPFFRKFWTFFILHYVRPLFKNFVSWKRSLSGQNQFVNIKNIKYMIPESLYPLLKPAYFRSDAREKIENTIGREKARPTEAAPKKEKTLLQPVADMIHDAPVLAGLAVASFLVPVIFYGLLALNRIAPEKAKPLPQNEAHKTTYARVLMFLSIAGFLLPVFLGLRVATFLTSVLVSALSAFRGIVGARGLRGDSLQEGQSSEVRSLSPKGDTATRAEVRQENANERWKGETEKKGEFLQSSPFEEGDRFSGIGKRDVKPAEKIFPPQEIETNPKAWRESNRGNEGDLTDFHGNLMKKNRNGAAVADNRENFPAAGEMNANAFRLHGGEEGNRGSRIDIGFRFKPLAAMAKTQFDNGARAVFVNLVGKDKRLGHSSELKHDMASTEWKSWGWGTGMPIGLPHLALILFSILEMFSPYLTGKTRPLAMSTYVPPYLSTISSKWLRIQASLSNGLLFIARFHPFFELQRRHTINNTRSQNGQNDLQTPHSLSAISRADGSTSLIIGPEQGPRERVERAEARQTDGGQARLLPSTPGARLPARQGRVRRIDLENAAGKVVDALDPVGSEELKRLEVRKIYEAANVDLEGLIRALLKEAQRKLATLQGQEGTEILSGAVNLVERLLAPYTAETGRPERLKINLAVAFSETEGRESFFEKLFHAIQKSGSSAQISSDGESYRKMAHQFNETMREFLSLRKLSAQDMAAGIQVTAEAEGDPAGIPVALDSESAAKTFHEIFQGMMFRASEDSNPNAQYANELLFAGFLVKAAMIFSQPQAKAEILAKINEKHATTPDAIKKIKADYLKNALIRALQDLGYPGVDNAISTPGPQGILTLYGKVIAAAIAEYQTRAEVRKAA